MKARLLCSTLAVVALALPSVAAADVGPPPECPDGCYRVYHRGNKCVPNGYHLEDSDAGPQIDVVADVPSGQPAPSGSAPPPRKLGEFCNVLAAKPSATVTPASSVAAPAPSGGTVEPPKGACGCRVAERADTHPGAQLSAALLSACVLLRLRRRKSGANAGAPRS